MAATHTPQAGPNGPRRPRAWLARRLAAVLSVAAMLGLGGLMYWNDQQATAGTTQAASTTPSQSTSSGSSTTSGSSVNRSDRERGEGGEGGGEGEHESDDGGSIVDDIASLIPGLSGNSSSSNTTSNRGSQQQSVPAPHTNTRGS